MRQDMPFRCSEPFSSNRPPSDTPNVLDNVPLPTDLMMCVAPLNGLSYTEFGDDGNVTQKTVSGASLRDEVQAAVSVVEMEFGPEPPTGTTIHGLATIRVYSGKTMFNVVNSALRSSVRSEASLRPLLPFLKLLLHTLRSLPAEYRYQGMVYRCEIGVHPNFADRYQSCRKTAFYGFTSCTTSPAVLSQFGAQGGIRTVFHLDVTRGYRIEAFSNFTDEVEVLLEPCATFEVTDSQNYSDPTRKAMLQAANAWNDNMEGLHEVMAVQIKSVYELLKLEGLPEAAPTTVGLKDSTNPTSVARFVPPSQPSQPPLQQQQQRQPTLFPDSTQLPHVPFAAAPVPPPPARPLAQGPSSALLSSVHEPCLTALDSESIAQIMDACNVDEATATNAYVAENKNLQNAISTILELGIQQMANFREFAPLQLLAVKPRFSCSDQGSLATTSHVWRTGEQASQNDDPVAISQFNMAVRYDQGNGVPQDRKLAAELYEMAANKGLTSAMCNLGNMHFEGRGIPRDVKRAFEWYEKAAHLGREVAQYRLAVAYGTGEGAARDDRLAAYWYERAAEQGLSVAQHNLGTMYAQGRGVPRDEHKAAFWWEKAKAAANQRQGMP